MTTCIYIIVKKFKGLHVKNIKIKEILKIKEEKEIYTKAIVTNVQTKLSKQGTKIYFIEITDELGKITVCLLPEYFEQEIKIYAHEPIVNDELKPKYKINDNLDLSNFVRVPSSMKIKCVMSKDMNSMNYFLCNIQKSKKITFRYKTDYLPKKSDNIIKTRESIENIHRVENYKGYIDYKIALGNVSLFEELCFQDNRAEITLYNLDEEIVDIYKQIFEFIANGGYLIYHTAGIVKRHSPEETRRLAYKRKILSDLRGIFHGCFFDRVKHEEELEICSLIFDERIRLRNKFI